MPGPAISVHGGLDVNDSDTDVLDGFCELTTDPTRGNSTCMLRK